MGDRALDRDPLMPQIVGDGPLKPRVGELVRRIREGGPIAARELVLALGPRLDPPQAAGEREVDRLIIADLEMKERVVLDRPPVAAVERVVAEKIDRAGDIASRPARHDEERAVGEYRPDQIEEGAGEVGAAPFARAGLHVEFEEGVPVRRTDRRAGQPFNLNPAVERLAPLAPDRLTLAGSERSEKIVERGIAVAGEMELLAGADEKSGARQPVGVLGRGKSEVNRRGLGLFAQLPQGSDQRLARAFRRIAGYEEPASGHRRERDRDLELGIIAAAGALVGVGPGVVEHVLALAVGLEVARRD